MWSALVELLPCLKKLSRISLGSPLDGRPEVIEFASRVQPGCGPHTVKGRREQLEKQRVHRTIIGKKLKKGVYEQPANVNRLEKSLSINKFWRAYIGRGEMWRIGLQVYETARFKETIRSIGSTHHLFIISYDFYSPQTHSL